MLIFSHIHDFLLKKYYSNIRFVGKSLVEFQGRCETLAYGTALETTVHLEPWIKILKSGFNHLKPETFNHQMQQKDQWAWKWRFFIIQND